MSKRFYIDYELCNSCGKCTIVCLEHISVQGQKHVNLNNPNCLECLQCYTACPQNAIKLYDTDEGIPQAEPAKLITEESLSSFLALRRSARVFQKKTVDDSIVEKLIDSARYIPSGGNEHSHEFTVLKSEEIKMQLRDELNKIYSAKLKLLNNPVLKNIAKLIVDKPTRSFLNDDKLRLRIKRYAGRAMNGVDMYFYNAPIVVIIHSKRMVPTPKEDCVLAAYNIGLVAETLGIGTCMVTLAQAGFNESNKCKELLGLVPDDNVYEVVVLGYPVVHHKRIAPRPKKQINWC